VNVSFKEEYLKHKKENKTDAEIMEVLDIPPYKFYELKKMNDLIKKSYGIKRPRMNYCGLTDEMLRKGESIGLSKRLMYKRVRELYWDHERAVTEPKGKRGGKRE
jgi:hypothetical protein